MLSLSQEPSPRIIWLCILTANQRFLFLAISTKIKYWRPTKWTQIIASFDPTFEASGMEIMPFVASQLGDCIGFLIVHEADDTTAFMLKYLGIILRTS